MMMTMMRLREFVMSRLTELEPLPQRYATNAIVEFMELIESPVDELRQELDLREMSLLDNFRETLVGTDSDWLERAYLDDLPGHEHKFVTDLILGAPAAEVDPEIKEGEAEAAKETALARVASSNAVWFSAALKAIPHYPKDEATGEEIRLFVQSRVGRPAHHNATGALIRSAKARGLLAETGRYSSMKTTRSHARKTPVYRVNHAD